MVAWQMPCRALLPNGMSRLFKAMIDQGSGLACRPRGRSRRKTSGQPRAVCSGRAAATAGLNPISRATGTTGRVLPQSHARLCSLQAFNSWTRL